MGDIEITEDFHSAGRHYMPSPFHVGSATSADIDFGTTPPLRRLAGSFRAGPLRPSSWQQLDDELRESSGVPSSQSSPSMRIPTNRQTPTMEVPLHYHGKVGFAHESDVDGQETEPLLPGVIPMDTRKNELPLLQQVPAVFIAFLLNLLLAVPIGMIILPASFAFKQYIGIPLFLLSTSICQFIFVVGSSFRCSVGVMMIENIPFFHQMAESITEDIGRGPEYALPTVMCAYAIATILVGIIFGLMGVLKTGSVMYFIPRHILVGCIGGIGVFLIVSSIEMSTGMEWEWNVESFRTLFQTPNIWMYLVTVGFVVVLHVTTHWVKTHLFPPFYFISIPILFHLVVYLAGYDLDYLHGVGLGGWLFPKVPDCQFYEIWTLYDFPHVHWDIIFKQTGVMAGLVFFSLMHVPINIPSLGVTTGSDADLNRELVMHGWSNLVAGCVGTLQNYLTYSSSALFYKCGGNSRWMGLLLAILNLAAFFVGPSPVAYIPRCLAGAMILHIGIELTKEAVWDSISQLRRTEYLTVLIIVVTMALSGFISGLVVGLLLALLFYVVNTSRASVIRTEMSGDILTSNVTRPAKHQKVLQQQMHDESRVHLLQLQGHLFFGTTVQLKNRVDSLIHPKDDDCKPVAHLIIDFRLVSSMDCSACASFEQISRLARMSGVHLMYTGLHPDESFYLQSVGATIDGDIYTHEFRDVDSALEWVEDKILAESGVETLATPPSLISPRRRRSASTIDENTMLQTALHDLCPNGSEENLKKLQEYFVPRRLSAGTTLWRRGDEPNVMYVLVFGRLSILWDDDPEARWIVGQGAMVGEKQLFTGETRDYTLVAGRDSTVLTLSKDSLERMRTEDPQLLIFFQTLAFLYVIQHLNRQRVLSKRY